MPARQVFKDKEKKFRLLFDASPQPMWVVDAESQRFLEINPAAVKLYGYSVDEFRALALGDVQAPEDAARFLAEISNPSRTGRRTWRHYGKGRRLIEVEISANEIPYDGRKAYLAVLVDVTGRHELEDQLRQSQKMEAVGMLAGGVAHDFNNLLTIITGYAQLILNNLGASDPNRHSVEQILKAGDRAATLTRQLLAFSRRQVLQPKVIDLNRLVDTLSTMLRRLIGEHIELRLALGRDLGSVSADPGQIEQVLMNLTVNARDAMPKGGRLTLETGNVILDEGYTSRHITVRPGRYVLLAVSDTGVGMDKATREHLFEPFFTTKPPGHGTGLGLSTVFGIVKQSGGSVAVYSEPGRGTTVKVYLPRIDQPAAVEPEPVKKTVRRGAETILVAEDDEMVRTLVRETLRREGYKVLAAEDPIEALSIAEKLKGSIDLLITDVVMPKVSGRELAETLQNSRPAVKVLYMSGYTDSAVLSSGILESEVAFLQKPFTPAALIDKVHEVLGSNGKTHQACE